MPTPLEERLREIVRNSRFIMATLSAARSLHLPQWCIGAGAIRNLVWDHLHGYAASMKPGDIDFAYFDPSDISCERDRLVGSMLDASYPGIPWEAVNQAGVHLWYEEYFGKPVEPFHSLSEALASWPEFATCVGVRLEDDDSLIVIAPHGLADLFEMKIRRNPTRIDLEAFRKRISEKRFADKWPLVRIIDG